MLAADRPSPMASHERDASAAGATAGTSPEFAAAIDLGSHSFHLLIVRLQGGEPRIVDRLRERVNLAAGLDEQQDLGEEAAERALECLRRFGQRLTPMPRSCVRVVGTNTLRQARNAASFLSRATLALGYPIEVVSGREEARLIYLGVTQAAPHQGRRLVIDIGGGSTELIIGERSEILEADSLFMGCVSYTKRFFPTGAMDSARFRDAELAAELELAPLLRRYKGLGYTQAIGCSGTVHAAREVVRANGWCDEGLSAKSLQRLKKALLAAGELTALELPGLPADRKPVFAGGVAILCALFERFGIEHLATSPGALREGALADLLGRIHDEDVRERTIATVEAHYHVDSEHAARVERTALALFDGVVRDGGPRERAIDPAAARQLLHWASRLFEIGLSINHTGYHRHSAYLVANSYLAGFSSGEQQLLGAIILAHRRKLHREAFDEIEPSRLEDARELAVVFRIATSLNRSRDAELPRFSCRLKNKTLRLSFPPCWLDERPLTRAALEDERQYVAGLGYVLVLRETDEPSPIPSEASPSP